ncbi:MAG: ABC transporter ATP-binding protein [Gemmatimonadetes bacterium]|nr:ABC transporter ATP-binding protein [Gemmatimonadota bacterium]
MITLERVTKRYGSLTAVDRVNLEVPPGTLFGLLGPNGAGKTTLVRMVAGILRPDEGRIRIVGLDVQAEPEAAKARLGFIPDRPYLYEKLTGAEFLRFVAGLYGLDGRQVEGRIDEFLDFWELSSWRDELVETYSHGMRQRLVVASAFIHRPEVIVVDEPMIGLDPKAARLLNRIFREFVRRGGTILMSTHSLGIAEALCERIAIIQEGRIRAEGTVEDLRRLVAAGDVSLEDVFLRLTGGEEVRELLDVLGE